MNIKNRVELLSSQKLSNNSQAMKRILRLVDSESFTQINSMTKSDKDYAGIVTGVGTIDGEKVCVFSQDKEINSGAFNKAQANKLLKLYDIAFSNGIPIIGIYDCAGACLNDANTMFKGLSDVLAYSNKLSGVVPQLSVVLGPCLGITSLLVANSDFTVASKQADFGLKTGDKDSDLQDEVENGNIAVLTEDEDSAINEIKKIFSFLPQNNLDLPAEYEPADSIENNFNKIATGIFAQNKKAYNGFLKSFADGGYYISLQEAFGDSVTTAFARVYGKTVGCIIFKGENLKCNACTKVARFVRFCDAFSIPIVTFTDAKEFNCLKGATKLTNAYCDATTAKISVITGKAFGAVFAATSMQGSSSDLTLAWLSASVSAMNPVSAAVFYHGDELKNSDNPIEDRKKIIKNYVENETTPFDMAGLGLIQDVILPDNTRREIAKILDVYESKRVQKLPKKHSINI